jgi:hypothetical protein
MKVYIGRYPKKAGEQKIKVHIDKWDTWNMDHTLAHIIHPMLVQLKATKHGAPNVDDEDVPEVLRSTSAPPKLNDYDVDEFHFDRWDYVLDEMIWSFSQELEGNWQDQYYSGKSDHWHQAYDKDNNPIGELFRYPDKGPKGYEYTQIVEGPNHTFKVDMEGLKTHHDRIKNGLRLFGKYYQNLWD